MGAGARFRMTLKTECRAIGEAHTLQRAVEQRAVGGAEVPGQTRLIDREAVVLTRDQHLARAQILHRVVGPVMTDFHLQGARAAGQRQYLMTQANAENGHPGIQQRAHRGDGVGAGLRITGPVGQEHPVRG